MANKSNRKDLTPFTNFAIWKVGSCCALMSPREV